MLPRIARAGLRGATSTLATLALAPRGMCTENVQPIGSLRGRVGAVVDALGVVCDEP